MHEMAVLVNALLLDRSAITGPYFNGMVYFTKHQKASPEERGNGGTVRGKRLF